MLKRIKETLTCNSSGGRSRTIRQFKLHLLHGDKNTYFYKSNGKVKNILYSSKISTIPLVLSAFGLLLVLGLSIGCIGGHSNNSIAYAEGENEAVAQSDNASVSLSLADTANSGNMTIIGENKSIQEQVDTTNNTGYIAVDFHVTATNIDKYDVYVQSSNSALIGETNGGKVESISSNTAYTDIVNHAGWGYAVAEGANVNAETLTYKPIQTSASSAVDSGSATNTTVNKDYTLAFAANLTGATADHYKSNITLSVAAGAGEVTNLYSVTYNTNNSTGGTTPATQTAETNSETYTFAAPQQNDLVRDGYTFMGWAGNPSATTPEYRPGSVIALTKDTPQILLYAVWGNATTPESSWENLYFMQQMTPEACAGGDAAGKQLVDFRDNKTYWVAKLADGNCWMTQNLDLDLHGVTLKPDTSDVTVDWVSTTKASTLWGGSGATDVKYFDPGKGYCANNTTDLCDLLDTQNDNHDARGNYYSWLAATAETISEGETEAPGSICPKGWRLPAGGDSSSDLPSFTGLANAYGITDSVAGANILMGQPLYYILSGYINNNSVQAVGQQGRYWSSTSYEWSKANNLCFYPYDVYPTGNDNRSAGYSVRCVAR